MAFQNVCIIGATGSVGSKLVEQIEEFDRPGLHANPTRIVGMVNKRGYIVDAGGIENPAALSGDRARFAESAVASTNLSDVLQRVRDEGLEGDVVFVDVTAESTRGMLDVHKLIVGTRQKLVTANKAPIAEFDMGDFRRLTDDRTLYRYNASVMAGAGAVPYLQDSVDLNDRVHSIEGCFSGTLGYICTGLEEGKTFSEVVAQAHSLKYTEPNPWHDLNGADVARKLIILARSAGYDVNMRDIDLTPFIPARYGDVADTQEFLSAIRAEDDRLRQEVTAAAAQGNVLRFVARFTKNGGAPHLSVGLTAVPRDGQLGQLKGTANLVKIVTEKRAPEGNPHIIIAQGAGTDKTAAEVRADLLRLLPNRTRTFTETNAQS